MLKLEFWIMYSILCSPRLHLFDQKYSKNSNIVKYYLSSVLKKKSKLHFQHYYSSLQCHVIIQKSF